MQDRRFAVALCLLCGIMFFGGLALGLWLNARYPTELEGLAPSMLAIGVVAVCGAWIVYLGAQSRRG